MVSGHQRGVLSVQVTDWTKLKDFSIRRHNTGQMWLLKGHYSGKRGSARKRSGRSSPDGKYSGSLLLWHTCNWRQYLHEQHRPGCIAGHISFLNTFIQCSLMMVSLPPLLPDLLHFRSSSSSTPSSPFVFGKQTRKSPQQEEATKKQKYNPFAQPAVRFTRFYRGLQGNVYNYSPHLLQQAVL